MSFADTQLQACFDLKLLEQASAVSDEQREVGALIATHDWFQMVEGSHSARVHETLDRLLSPEVRPGLIRWYRNPGSDTGDAAIEFRKQLNQLAGGWLGRAAVRQPE